MLRKLVDGELALGVVSHIVSPELPLIIMSGLEPCDHRMLVGLPNLVLVSPLIVFSLVNIERLALNVQRVGIIAKLKPVIIISALFLNAQILCLCEGDD